MIKPSHNVKAVYDFKKIGFWIPIMMLSNQSLYWNWKIGSYFSAD